MQQFHGLPEKQKKSKKNPKIYIKKYFQNIQNIVEFCVE